MSTCATVLVHGTLTDSDDFVSFEPIRCNRIEFMPVSRISKAKRARHRSCSAKRTRMPGVHRRGIKYRYGG